MPPNARDSDDISQEAETSDLTQATSTANGASNNQRNNQSNNNNPEQNGLEFPPNPSTSESEQRISHLQSDACNNVSHNLTNGNAVASRLEDNNATIYIIPTHEPNLNPSSSMSIEQQPELNANNTSVPQHLFLLPSVPHQTNLTISQPYPSYNQAAPPDYFPNSTTIPSSTYNQPRIYLF